MRKQWDSISLVVTYLKAKCDSISFVGHWLLSNCIKLFLVSLNAMFRYYSVVIVYVLRKQKAIIGDAIETCFNEMFKYSNLNSLSKPCFQVSA